MRARLRQARLKDLSKHLSSDGKQAQGPCEIGRGAGTLNCPEQVARLPGFPMGLGSVGWARASPLGPSPALGAAA